MAARLRDINPDVDINIVSKYIHDEQLIEVYRSYDYLVDAIDTLSPKTFLLYYAIKSNLRVVSSMGAGGKLDPLQIRIDDISKTYNCRLARTLRERLRKHGVTTGIKAVFSTEIVDNELVIPCDEPNKKSIVGTISYIPAMFGCVCASVVIRDLIEDKNQ